MARSAKKTTRNGKTRQNKEILQELQRKKRESKGVICIAFGVLLLVYLFIDATGALGDLLSHLLFGLFGWAAYVIPVMMIVAGGMIIHGSHINDFGNADWMFIVAALAVITLFNVGLSRPYKAVAFTSYVADAFEYGSKYRLGGGSVGSILAYPLRQVFNNVGAYIVLIALLVVTLLQVTRISIKKVSTKIGKGVSKGVSHVYHSAQENVSRAIESRAAEPRPERKPRKFAFFELVDREEPAEEFDNPFLPERKQSAAAEMEGFDSYARDFAVKEEPVDVPQLFGDTDPVVQAPAAPDPEPAPEKNVHAYSPFNPDMGMVASLRKSDEEHNVKHLSASVERPSSVAARSARAERTFVPLDEAEFGAVPLKKSRYNIVPPPIEEEDPDEIWADLDEEALITPEQDPVPEPAEPKESVNVSYEVPAFLPRVPGNPVYAPAPVSLRRPGSPKEREQNDPFAEKQPVEPAPAPVSFRPQTAQTKPLHTARPGAPAFTSTMSAASAKPGRPQAPVSQDAARVAAAPVPKEPQRSAAVPAQANPFQPDPHAYMPPPFDLLDEAKNSAVGMDDPEAAANTLVTTLQNFGISVKILGYSVGPVITRFELQPAPGVRVSRITGLSNDIALALAAERVRIEAPIPGKSAVGIEVPNKHSVGVVLREIVESNDFTRATSPITLAFGKDIAGKVVTANLEKMPHLLIAGATGSGKSVCINDLLLSMVFKSSPDDVRMILIDPKVVELKVYSELPHLLIPVVTDPKKAAGALRWAVNEMMNRYKMFSERGVRNIQGYNETIAADKKYPRLVVIIDELADLMMVAPDDVEDSICRIAQLGRAAGIHLIVATQRPSADIITGLIKANIPSRCAFAVSSGIDSRIILDEMGAEKLLGKGDMLFHPNGSGKPMRCQCAFVSDDEVERIMNWFKGRSDGAPTYDEKFVEEVMNPASGGATGGAFGDGKQEDELFLDALGVVVENGVASISMIQRRLRVGYARAARLIDMMEQKGYVSGFEGSKPRRLLITKGAYARLVSGGDPDAGEDDEVPFDTDEE